AAVVRIPDQPDACIAAVRVRCGAEADPRFAERLLRRADAAARAAVGRVVRQVCANGTAAAGMGSLAAFGPAHATDFARAETALGGADPALGLRELVAVSAAVGVPLGRGDTREPEGSQRRAHERDADSAQDLPAGHLARERSGQRVELVVARTLIPMAGTE